MVKKSEIKIGEEYVIDVPLDEITCRGIRLGERENLAYFKLDDKRYALIKTKEIEQTGEYRIKLSGNLDVRENKHFLSKKDWLTIADLEGEL